MIKPKIINAMNEQIQKELYSAYLYLAMAAFAESSNLPGFARWMSAQAKEEVEHAMKFYGYIHDRGGKVILQAIDQPPAEFGGPTALFEETLAHEKKVTASIHALYALASEEKDYASQAFLQWFVTEQVEEEKNASTILDSLKMAGEKGTALFMMDRQLGARA